MAHTEAEIRRAIKPLLTVYGELNTSEVKNLLHTVLTFDDEDKRPSETRPGETLIMQRIRNIVGRPENKVEVFNEGFVLNKNYRPAKFSLLNPILNDVIQPEEVTNIKEKTKRFTARKVDWEKVRDRNNEIGDQGEEFVLEFETDRLVETLSLKRTKAIQNVQHLSRLQGDGLGYDIYSINNDGSPRYIEVKTTSGDFNQPFFMSENERRFFKEYGESAFIYRVYNFNKEARHGDVKVVTSSDLFSDFAFDTTTWKVTPK